MAAVSILYDRIFINRTSALILNWIDLAHKNFLDYYYKMKFSIPQQERYSGLLELYGATFSNGLWLILFFLFCILWQLFRFIGDKLCNKYIERQSPNVVPVIRSVLCLFHSSISCIAATIIFCKYGFDIHGTANETNNGVIIFYKLATIISSSYFANTTYIDAVMPIYSIELKILLPIHHALAGLLQAIVFSCDSFACMLSAMLIQVEFGPIFISINEIAESVQNAKWYRWTAWLKLIVYPINRLIFLPIFTGMIYDSKDLIEDKTGKSMFYFVFISCFFILSISFAYYVQILISVASERWDWFELSIIETPKGSTDESTRIIDNTDDCDAQKKLDC